MIFYFSGTGNSKYAADTIAAATKDKVVFMSLETLREKQIYELTNDERIGFVFPVYWYGMPKIVEHFLNTISFKNYNGQYAYAVITYGGSSGNTMKSLEQVLKHKNITLQAEYGVKMVDNYILYYDPASEDVIRERITNAKQQIATIADNIANRKEEKSFKRGAMALGSGLSQAIYKRINLSKKFCTTDDCTKCGKCVRECPLEAIEMASEGVIWTGDCTGCLKCIHSCPKQAIQYGNGTKKRRRYSFDKEAKKL